MKLQAHANELIADIIKNSADKDSTILCELRTPQPSSTNDPPTSSERSGTHTSFSQRMLRSFQSLGSPKPFQNLRQRFTTSPTLQRVKDSLSNLSVHSHKSQNSDGKPRQVSISDMSTSAPTYAEIPMRTLEESSEKHRRKKARMVPHRNTDPCRWNLFSRHHPEVNYGRTAM